MPFSYVDLPDMNPTNTDISSQRSAMSGNSDFKISFKEQKKAGSFKSTPDFCNAHHGWRISSHTEPRGWFGPYSNSKLEALLGTNVAPSMPSLWLAARSSSARSDLMRSCCPVFSPHRINVTRKLSVFSTALDLALIRSASNSAAKRAPVFPQALFGGLGNNRSPVCRGARVGAGNPKTPG